MIFRKKLVSVTAYVPQDLRELMELAVRRGDFDGLSEIGREALKAWAEEYKEKLARNRIHDGVHGHANHH